MNEIPDIHARYKVDDIGDNLNSAEQVSDYALDFFEDVTKIYRLAIDQKNPVRNPSGYSLNDAPILGLLVRIWNLSTLIVQYFEQKNGEFIATIHRPLVEASVTALYLLRQDDAVIRDYRRCSYNDALRILRDYKAGSPFFRTRAGRHLLTSVRENLALEGLTEDSFSPQKRNGWRLQGKSFFRIFESMFPAQSYPALYGLSSESIHGSWNNSMDWSLIPNEDGTYSAYSLFKSADLRVVSSAFHYSTQAYRLWLKRVEAENDNLINALNAIERINSAIVHRFNELFDGQVSAAPENDRRARPRAQEVNGSKTGNALDELRAIMSKYDGNYVDDFLDAGDTLDRYALNFYEDVVEIYDLVSRLRPNERNPTGFSSNDAAILGLLIRTWKLLRQALELYKTHHAEFILVVERSVVESAVMATYLLKNDDSVVEDYRMCSYRNRLRILRELQTGSPFAATKPGRRLLNSIQEKLERDNLTQASFSRQDANGWRVQGKTFFDIFEEVLGPELYRTAYGVLSETVHGSWLESVDWSLTQHRDGTFSPRYELDSAPIGFVSLLLLFSTLPYRLWVERIQVDDHNISQTLNWIDKFNSVLLEKYEYMSESTVA